MERTSLRFSIWYSEAAVEFNKSHLPMLEQMGVGIGGGTKLGIIIYSGTRHIHIFPYDKGHRVTATCYPHVWPYLLRDRDVDERLQFARCKTTPLPFDFDGAKFMGVLPPDHELPWPRLVDCNVYGRRDAALHEIQVRSKSAMDAGLGRLSGVPTWAQRELTSAERVQLFTHGHLQAA